MPLLVPDITIITKLVACLYWKQLKTFYDINLTAKFMKLSNELYLCVLKESNLQVQQVFGAGQVDSFHITDLESWYYKLADNVPELPGTKAYWWVPYARS